MVRIVSDVPHEVAPTEVVRLIETYLGEDDKPFRNNVYSVLDLAIALAKDEAAGPRFLPQAVQDKLGQRVGREVWSILRHVGDFNIDNVSDLKAKYNKIGDFDKAVAKAGEEKNRRAVAANILAQQVTNFFKRQIAWDVPPTKYSSDYEARTRGT